MSQLPPTNTPSPLGSPGQRRRNQASVRLGDPLAEQSGAGAASDTATRSLGDALRITYRVLQFFMFAVFGLYALSGFRQINANERGINLTFGKVVGSNLPPGFQFSWPAPVGELIKINVSDEPLELRRDFWINLSETEDKRIQSDPSGVQSLAGGGTDALDPESDGMLLLGDGSIAHAQVKLTYKRDNPVKYAAGIDPAFEKNIIAGAVRRGVVQTVAGLSLDQFINNENGDGRTVDEAAKFASQQALAQLDAGISLSEFSIVNRIPPRRVMPAFNMVQSATQDANKRYREAMEFRSETLVEIAGEAAEAILGQIDLYEQQIGAGKTQDAANTLVTIDRLFSAEKVTIDGVEIPPRITGRVTSILDEARQYRNSLTNRAQADLAVFNAKRQTFRDNPRVMVAGEWATAFSSFLNRPSVQTLVLPPNSDRIVVQLNRDPHIARAQEQERNAKEFADAEANRRRLMEQNRHQEKIDASTKGAPQQ